jgi:hypothetical protein
VSGSPEQPLPSNGPEAAARFPERKVNTWLARFQHPDADPPEATLIGVASPRHPAGSTVDMPAVGPGLTAQDVRLIQVRFVPSTRRVVRAQVFEPIAPGAPDMVYTETSDAAGPQLALIVVGFELPDTPAAAEIPEGTFLNKGQWDALQLRPEDQIAAVQWWPHNGQVTQVYVAPAMRRRRVGSKIASIAECVTRSRSFPPLRGSGERTELGQAWVSATPDFAVHRIAELTVVRPPMTPREAAEGVPRRNLEVSD